MTDPRQDGWSEPVSDAPVLSMVPNEFPEKCVRCADWVYPTWTVTWVGGHSEIRCGIHGGSDQEGAAEL